MRPLHHPDLGAPARTGEKTVMLSIDGRLVGVSEGSSVMRAPSEAGILIPRLCATDRQEPSGGCRLCLVEIHGRDGYPASCTTKVEEGMVVRTASDALSKLRHDTMELYLSDHTLDCLTCAANGDCQLQDMAGLLGVRSVRYGHQGENHLELPSDESNPYFAFDPAKCILCSRCVTACSDLQGTFALSIVDRGFAAKIAASQDEPFLGSECVSCGACVDACPTAALIDKSVVEQGLADRAMRTTCPYCGVGCELEAELQGGKVVRLTPARDGKANHGHACVKGRFAWGFVNHPDRITQPMIRDSIDDPWQPVTWDEAIGFAAGRLKSIITDYGPKAIGVISSSRCTNEENYIMQKFARAALGNNNIDNCARVCHAPTGYGLKATLGGSAGTQHFDSVEDSDVIMIVGSNTDESHPVFGARLKKRVREGAKLIVIDPRRIGMVAGPHYQADYHLSLYPGANLAVLNSLAHVIVTEDLIDHDFVENRCEAAAFADWRAVVADAKYAPQTVAEIAGVSADDIRSAARLYATGGNAAIYYGLGVTEHTQGSTGVMALANLAMVTGNFGRMGVGVSPMRGQNNVQGACDMGCFPDVFPGYRSVADDEIRGTFEQAWGVELDDTPGICIPSMIDASASGAMKGLYVQGEDIAQSDPNIAHVEKALSELDCLIVQDLFLNQTANFAHVFLPGASFLEKDGTFINAERRITRINKILPPASGLSDWQITQVLSNAMGYQMSYRNASVIMDEIAQLTPTFAGVSYARIDALGSLQWPCNEAAPEGTEIMHVGQFTRGLGKFMDTTFTPSPEEVTADFPLRLTTGRILTQYNSGVQTRRTDNVVWHEEDKLEINAADAEVRNIHDDDLVAITSRSGTTSLRARVTPRVPPGVVYTTFHHPETGLNVITSDYRDWMTECPEYKFTAVQVERTERPSDWQADHEETERRGHRIAHAEGEPS